MILRVAAALALLLIAGGAQAQDTKIYHLGNVPAATNTVMGKVRPGAGCSITTPGVIDCAGTPTCSTTITNQGNSDASLPANQLYTAINAALTSPRTLTLPAASAAGSCPYSIYDKAGGVGSTNTETIARAGADTINGGVSWALTGAYQSAVCQSDGVSAWTCYAGNNLSPAAGQFVTGISCTSGGCSLTFGTITASTVPKANAGGTALADGTILDQGTTAGNVTIDSSDNTTVKHGGLIAGNSTPSGCTPAVGTVCATKYVVPGAASIIGSAGTMTLDGSGQMRIYGASTSIAPSNHAVIEPGGDVQLTPAGNISLSTVGGYISLGQGLVEITDASSAHATGGAGEMAIRKITDPNSAPGAGWAKLTVEAGTNAGTCKVVVRAGTSATAVTIVDNVGAAC